MRYDYQFAANASQSVLNHGDVTKQFGGLLCRRLWMQNTCIQVRGHSFITWNRQGGGGPARFPHFSTRGVGSQFHVDKCSASCLRFIIFAPITKLLFVMFRAI